MINIQEMIEREGWYGTLRHLETDFGVPLGTPLADSQRIMSRRLRMWTETYIDVHVTPEAAYVFRRNRPAHQFKFPFLKRDFWQYVQDLDQEGQDETAT